MGFVTCDTLWLLFRPFCTLTPNLVSIYVILLNSWLCLSRYYYALFIPYFYIEEYARLRGVSSNISPYLLTIINGCGIPARIIPGLLGDRFGV